MIALEEHELEVQQIAAQAALVTLETTLGLPHCRPAESRVVDQLVSLLHWCDSQGVLLDVCLDQDERIFVDQVLEPSDVRDSTD